MLTSNLRQIGKQPAHAAIAHRQPFLSTGMSNAWCANPILLNAVPAKFVSRLRLLLNPFHKNEVSFRGFFTDQFGSCIAI